LTKGTAYKNATEIAQQIEFLGAGLSTRAGWNGSSATVFVMKDKLGKALSLMSDSVIRPVFPEKELALFKKQALDGFSVSMKQPGSLLNYVAAAYAYGEHPTDGTPETVKRIKRSDLVSFHKRFYAPGNSVLVFAGDIAPETAFGYARLFFGGWTRDGSAEKSPPDEVAAVTERPPTVRRILVVDLPKSGQAAVGFANKLEAGRNESKNAYFAATVLNSVLGGGYSARLNQEIRLKRGLSYGARSGFSWRSYDSNFIAVAQTKNESAGQVAELMQIEIDKLIEDSIPDDEMVPRKAVVTGGFGRSLQTNNGLANQLSELYAFGLSAGELNSFTSGVKAVTAKNIRSFAGDNLAGGDMIIVGDASMFLDDLKKRFPDHNVEVIESSKLNLNKSTLR
ncbi:MAG: insulinase family protein, partial [Acidobacteriota bacterium]|nr:insulinase family protein [Acidobacteriota bacterium]